MLKPSFATKQVTDTTTYGVFELSPLPYGYAHSLGNALRRVLLSSIEGAAVTYVKVNGVPHVFSPLKGIKETALELIMNLKELQFALNSKEPLEVSVALKGARSVTGKDIKATGVEIVNPDHHIAEITDAKGSLDLSFIVEKGLGFSASEDKEKREHGMIAVDSIFSPVTKVTFRVEPARVGRVSNFDKLILEIWTNGSISPKDALEHSAAILAQFYSHMFNGALLSEEDATSGVAGSVKIDEKVYETIIDELDLPTRVINALLREGIETVGDLIEQGKETLVDLKGVGRKSLDLIEAELHKLGVGFKES
jgi:DNA-directed RNA polymerase subunit alpha